MTITCRACGSDDTVRFTEVASPTSRVAATFHRCRGCHSVTSDQTYALVAAHYNAGYIRHNLDAIAGRYSALREQVTTNRDLLVERTVPERSVLDIGCLDGALLDRMAEAGWQAYGFDVITEVPKFVAAATRGRVGAERIRIAPAFTPSVWGRQFGAVVLREVVEHVEHPRALLAMAIECLLPGGLLQVQTPQAHTDADDHDIAYQDQHLVLLAPAVLQTWVREFGLHVEDHRVWHRGQLVIGRKR